MSLGTRWSEKKQDNENAGIDGKRRWTRSDSNSADQRAHVRDAFIPMTRRCVSVFLLLHDFALDPALARLANYMPFFDASPPCRDISHRSSLTSSSTTPATAFHSSRPGPSSPAPASPLLAVVSSTLYLFPAGNRPLYRPPFAL